MTPAIEAARKAAVPFQVHSFTTESGVKSGLGAAAALNVPPARVFKTLIAKVDGGRLAVALVPADSELNLKLFAAAAGGKKADLADAAEAQRSTGYVLGGISPLGQRRSLTTCVDASAMQYPTIFVSGGRRGLEIEIAPQDLVALCGASVAPIAR